MEATTQPTVSDFIPTQPDEAATRPTGPDFMTTAPGLASIPPSPDSSNSVVGIAVGGAIAGAVMGVVIIVVCVILVFVKYLLRKKLKTHNQLGAAYGNTVRGKMVFNAGHYG